MITLHWSNLKFIHIHWMGPCLSHKVCSKFTDWRRLWSICLSSAGSSRCTRPGRNLSSCCQYWWPSCRCQGGCPHPGSWRVKKCYKQFSSELLSPVSRTTPVPVPAPVAPVAGGGELVAGPGPHRLPRALPRGRPLHGRGSGPPAVIHQTLSRGPQIWNS